MKRFLLALIVFATVSSGSLFAQHYIGVRGGWGGGSSRFKPTRETGMEWGLMSGGISYKFYSNVKFVGGIQADLQYLERGFMYDERLDGDTSYHRTVKSIDLPLMWQPHVYIFNRNARFFINLGLNFTYNMSSRQYWKSTDKGKYDEGEYAFSLTRDNRWGYGLVGGAGVSVFIKRFEIAVEGRYYFGYSDVLKPKSKNETNPLRSPLDNINISMGLYYRLNKEGIRSAPSKAALARMLRAEEGNASKNLSNETETLPGNGE